MDFIRKDITLSHQRFSIFFICRCRYIKPFSIGHLSDKKLPFQVPSYITRSCRQFISITTLCVIGRSPSANKRFLTLSEGYGYSSSGTQIAETSMWLPFLLYSIAILSDIYRTKNRSEERHYPHTIDAGKIDLPITA